MTEVIIVGSGRIRPSISELLTAIKEHPNCIILAGKEDDIPDIDFSATENRIIEQMKAEGMTIQEITNFDMPDQCSEEEENPVNPFAPVPPWHRSYKTNKKRLKR